MEIQEQTFSAGEVARAADISASTLQNWIKRRVIVGHREIKGGGSQGRHRRFSWFNVMEISIAAALVKSGVTDLPRAFHAAQKIAHTGYDPQRPGFPFHHNHGNTWLLVSGDLARVLAGGDDDSLSLPRAFPQNLHGPGYIALNVSQVFNAVCKRLDLGESQKLLDEVYPKEAIG